MNRIAWALRDPRMTSVVIGASSVAQLETTSPRSTARLTDDELAAIDQHAVDAGINLGKPSATSPDARIDQWPHAGTRSARRAGMANRPYTW